MNNRLKLRIFSFFVIISMLLSTVGIPAIHAQPAAITFPGQELLGRPTDTSITISVMPDSAARIYYDYGTSSGVYPNQTSIGSATANTPYVVTITGLSADTKYYYRMQYSTDAGLTWTPRMERTFHTQRVTGDTFTFDVTSDSHVNVGGLGSVAIWTQTLSNVAVDHPDFLVDLGDTFAMDSVTDQAGANSAYSYQYQFFNIVSASSAIYIVSGNHEETEGWHMTASTGYHLPALATNALKKYYLNPEPDSFYSGDATTNSYVTGNGLLEDYYAFTWGDALFVMIDPFWFTTTKPYIGDMGGGESDTTGSGNRWDWTLGLTQFNWLKTTLQNSTAKYKFVFAHNMAGGSQDYSREGAKATQYVEWGGYNTNGTTWGWTTNRYNKDSQWGSKPVHQILVDNQVSAFIHGHDHEFAYEKKDGIVYQEIPSGGFTGPGFGLYTETGYTLKVLNSPGHLRFTVSPSQTTVEYIASGTSDGSGTPTVNGATKYSYTIDPYPTAVNLVNLSATSLLQGIQLDWQTAQETDLLGFNLFRAASPDGLKVKINPDLIPGINPGELRGNDYQYLDTTAKPGELYDYWVEWVGNGSSEQYGPMTAILLPFKVWLPLGLK